MSRIGNKPITFPSEVEIKIADGSISVKGPKGSLSQDIPEQIALLQEGNEVVVQRSDNTPSVRSLHGLTRSLVANMVQGVTGGFKKELEIVGVGYRVALKGKSLEFQVGYSHLVRVMPREGIVLSTPSPTRVVVEGIDKQAVGQMAADIRGIRRPEPYKGKGIRYVGEHVRRKAGKAGA